MKKHKISTVQCYLTLLFVVSLLLTNIVVSKQIILPFDYMITGGDLIFPLTYILSDVFSEVYGYRWSRVTCYLGFAANLFMVLVFELVSVLPYPGSWTGQAAFETILGNTPRIFIASAMAFILGDLINDLVFRKMKEAHIDSQKGFGLRAVVSSFFGELVDSLIFSVVAFAGIWDITTIIRYIFTIVVIKVLYEVVILPVTTFVVKKVAKYEQD